MDESITISIVIDTEAVQMLEVICKMDERNRSQAVRWLVRQEYARRFSQPQPLVMVEEAEGVVK